MSRLHCFIIMYVCYSQLSYENETFIYMMSLAGTGRKQHVELFCWNIVYKQWNHINFESRKTICCKMGHKMKCSGSQHREEEKIKLEWNLKLWNNSQITKHWTLTIFHTCSHWLRQPAEDPPYWLAKLLLELITRIHNTAFCQQNRIQ